MRKIILLLMLLFLITGCAEQEEEWEMENLSMEELEDEFPEPLIEKVEEKYTKTEPALMDLGDFEIVYGETQNPRYAQLNELVKNSHVFDKVADFLNAILILQEDFPIIFKECGFVNAYYNPLEKEIVLCDELLENFAYNFPYLAATREKWTPQSPNQTYLILFTD